MRISLSASNYKNSNTTFKAKYKSDDPVLQMYFDDIEKYKPLTKPEKRKINEQIKQGGEIAEKAREKLVLSNLGRVIHIAQIYASEGISLSDLIQAGNMVLVKAAENFKGDCDRFWSDIIINIHNAVKREIMDNNSTVRIPVRAQENMQKYRKIADRFELRHGRKPTIKELSRIIGIREIFIKKLYSGLTQRADIDMDCIARTDTDAGEELDKKILRQDIKRLLSTLSANERYVLEASFGLKNGRAYDRFELARRCNTTPIRIIMAFNRGFMKIRDNLSAKIHEHLENS